MKPEDVKSYDDLAKLAVPRLQELASEDTDLKNTTALEKPLLLDALAKAYALQQPEQAKRADRGETQKLKKQMKQVKKQREEVLSAPTAQRDRPQLVKIRKQIKGLKRRMRKLAQ